MFPYSTKRRTNINKPTKIIINARFQAFRNKRVRMREGVCASRRAPVEGELYVGKETGNSEHFGRSQARGWTLKPKYHFILIQECLWRHTWHSPHLLYRYNSPTQVLKSCTRARVSARVGREISGWLPHLTCAWYFFLSFSALPLFVSSAF